MAAALLSPAFVAARLAPAAPPPPPPTEPYRKPRNHKSPNRLLLHPLPSSSSSSASSCALQCPHFQSCSGCTHEWDLDRPQVLQEVSKFFKDCGVTDFSFDSGRLWEWRCRAKLAIRGTPESPLVGLYQEGTHSVVDIPQCRAHHPSINAAVDLLKQGISKLNIQPFDEDLGTGELRYVQMAVTTYNTSLAVAERYGQGKVQVSLVWNSRNEHAQNSEKLNALSDFLWRNGGANSNIHLIHSVWANFQTSSSNIIFGNKWRHLLGERDFWEHVGGIDLSLDPSSFGQANTQAFCSLLRKLQKYVPRGSSVVDLYSGAGAIGLSVAATRKCRSVKCIEINKESKASFEKSASRLPKTVDCSISWHNTDASIEPVHWLEGADVVVVDPPRKGLHPSLVDALRNVALSCSKASKAPKRIFAHRVSRVNVGSKISEGCVETVVSKSSILKEKEEKRPWILRAREAAVHVDGKTNWENSQTWPATLIYISCGWESFKEDCKNLLSNNAWHLEKAHAFNFFPGTQSIEVLAVFKRGPRVAQKKKKSGKKKATK